MSETTHIAWCDATFNPWEGCTKVSPGCAHCYAEARNRRFAGGDLTQRGDSTQRRKDAKTGVGEKSAQKETKQYNWGMGVPRRRTSEENWKKARAWNRKPRVCNLCGQALNVPKLHAPTGVPGKWCGATNIIPNLWHRRRVFCGSLCDILDDEVPIEWFGDLVQLCLGTPHLDWLWLTKRPENFFVRLMAVLDEERINTWLKEGTPPRNIFMGTSAEDQPHWDDRVKKLQALPVAKRFVSVEPLLGAIQMFTEGKEGNKERQRWAHGLDWVILGGESDQPGHPARPCHVEWIRSGVQQCREAGVKVFVKQLGSNRSWPGDMSGESGRIIRDKKGGDMAEWPGDLRVREFPI